MAIPNAPLEGNGDKITFLTYDVSGTNTPAIPIGVAHKTLNGTAVAYAGVGTHGDGDDWVAGGPLVVMGGYDSVGDAVIKLLADASGHLAVRPPGAYDGGSALAFGHPTLLGGSALHGEEIGWLAIASHIIGGSVSSGQGLPLAGLSASGTVVAALGDTDGRAITTNGYTFGGNGHVAFTSGAAVPFKTGTQVCRKVIIRADDGNSTAAYIGNSGVSADNTAGTGGLQLPHGQELTIVADSLDLHTALYLKGSGSVGCSFIWFT